MKQTVSSYNPNVDEKPDFKNCVLDVKLNIIFARYLLQCEKIIKKEYCKEICVLIVYLGQTLNEIGYK